MQPEISSESIEDLQKEKLRLEIAELKRPEHRKLNSWISITTAIIAVGALIGQNFLSRAELANAEFDLKKKLSDSEAQLLKAKDEIKKLQNTADNERIRVIKYIESNSKVMALLDRPDLSDKGRAALINTVNRYYWIGVLGFGVPQERLTGINQFLSDQGYLVRFSSMLPSRPQWLSNRPTILYYSEKSEAKARALAAQLTESTHISYTVSKGIGFDVPAQQREWIIYIHAV